MNVLDSDKASLCQNLVAKRSAMNLNPSMIPISRNAHSKQSIMLMQALQHQLQLTNNQSIHTLGSQTDQNTQTTFPYPDDDEILAQIQQQEEQQMNCASPVNCKKTMVYVDNDELKSGLSSNNETITEMGDFEFDMEQSCDDASSQGPTAIRVGR